MIMECRAAVPTPDWQLEDPLAYLPFSTVVEYPKGRMVYGQDQLPAALYLVMDGRVKVSRIAENGHQVVIDIYKADDVFGESAFLNAHNRAEQASTLESTKLMIWSLATVQEIVVRRPRLAIALLQILVQRTISFKERIQSFSLETIACRLAHALLRFSERLGTRDESGAVRMVPFTHELLSQYVGTSREIVTHYMNEFRRQGCLNYSRRAIVLYPAVFGNWLSQNS